MNQMSAYDPPPNNAVGVEAPANPNVKVVVDSEDDTRVSPEHSNQPVVHNEHEFRHHLRQYISIAVILAVVTAIEVFLSYIHLFVAVPGPVVAALMILGMVIKFALVAMFFMHLKGDNKALSRVFAVGIAGALVLYLGMLFSYNVFTRPML